MSYFVDFGIVSGSNPPIWCRFGDRTDKKVTPKTGLIKEADENNFPCSAAIHRNHSKVFCGITTNNKKLICIVCWILYVGHTYILGLHIERQILKSCIQLTYSTWRMLHFYNHQKKNIIELDETVQQNITHCCAAGFKEMLKSGTACVILLNVLQHWKMK